MQAIRRQIDVLYDFCLIYNLQALCQTSSVRGLNACHRTRFKKIFESFVNPGNDHDAMEWEKLLLMHSIKLLRDTQHQE